MELHKLEGSKKNFLSFVHRYSAVGMHGDKSQTERDSALRGELSFFLKAEKSIFKMLEANQCIPGNFTPLCLLQAPFLSSFTKL